MTLCIMKAQQEEVLCFSFFKKVTQFYTKESCKEDKKEVLLFAKDVKKSLKT